MLGIKNLIIFDICFGIDFNAVLAPFYLLLGSQNGPKLGTHTCACACPACACACACTRPGVRVSAFWDAKSTPRGVKKHPQERPERPKISPRAAKSWQKKPKMDRSPKKTLQEVPKGIPIVL